MIYVELRDLRNEWRNAFNDVAKGDVDYRAWDSKVLVQIAELEDANNCTVDGGYDAGGYHCIDGIVFPNEQSLLFFKLKWS